MQIAMCVCVLLLLEPQSVSGVHCCMSDDGWVYECYVDVLGSMSCTAPVQ